MKKFLAILLVIVLTATASIAGTLAYLTDRDSKANVFTVGDVEIKLDEDFNQGATLIPGVEIEKEPTITNTGKNDAWVWAEIAIPSALNNTTSASKNALHFNMSKESVADGKWNWWDGADYSEGAYMILQREIDGVDYDVYVVQYETALKPGGITDDVIYKVYLDPHVDIDPDGNWAWVENGVATPIEWNSNTNGNPVVYVSAYAMQTEGFPTVYDAYDAYQGQWADKGTEYGALPKVSNNEELDAAIEAGATTIMLKDGTYIIPDSAQGKTLELIGSDKTIIATQDDGSYEGCDYSLDGATVTFTNVTINTDSSTYTGYARCSATYNNCTINGTYTLYGDSEFNNCTFNVSGDVYNIWTWGAPNATFNGCTFNSDGKALLLYGQANTKLTVNNCVFNDKGGLSDLKAAIEIGDDYGKSYELIVNNTTVNGYEINDKGILTGTTLWANKNSMGSDKLNVVVDGVDIY